MERRMTKEIRIGNRKIGGGNPILIQSMCNTKTEDAAATVAQILKLEQAGCDIIRVAVPTMEAAESLKAIKRQIHIPLVADIHFDYRLAIAAMECGADKIRINPGNIGSAERVQAVVDKAKKYGVPIRVGVNSGSLEKPLIEKYGGVTAEGIVESALEKVSMIEQMGYDNLVIQARACGVDTARIDEVVQAVGMQARIKDKFKSYSLGMKQRLGIAQAIMENQQLLILDEPMNALDKDAVEEMRKLFLSFKASGKTMLIVSHNEGDISTLCDEVYEFDGARIKRRENV